MLSRQLLSKRFFQTSARVFQETPILKDSTICTSSSPASATSTSNTAASESTASSPSTDISNTANESVSTNSATISNTEPLSAEPVNELGKGKKLLAKKHPIVILNAHQSRLIRRNGPNMKNSKQKNKPGRPRSEGKPALPATTSETSTIGSATVSRGELSLAEDIKRLSMKSKYATTEEIHHKIESIKPLKPEISKKRYQQIETELSRSFMAEQLKTYCRSQKRPVSSKMKKYETVQYIMDSLWKLKQSDSINPIEDTIIKRVFYLSKRQLFLILSQNVVNEWLRANVKLIVAVKSNQIIVHAPQAYIQYIEITIEGLLRGVKANEIDLGLVEELMKKNDQVLPLEDIQKLSGVYFEISGSSSATDSTFNMLHNYTMFFLARQKLLTALRLIVWSLNYEQHFTTTSIHINDKYQDRDKYKYFPTEMSDSTTPWNLRAKKWLQLKEPIRRDPTTKQIITSEKLDIDKDIDVKKLHAEINSISADPAKDQFGVTLVQFGNLVQEATAEQDSTATSTAKKLKPKYIMNTEIPYAHKKVLSFPLDLAEGETPDHDIDYHTYHAQLKLVPSPFRDSTIKDRDHESATKYPPIEFWFEINEAQRAVKNSLQAFIALKEQHSIVNLPGKSTDFKMVKSITQRLTQPYNEEDQDQQDEQQWLSDQPGIKKFLEKFNLDFSSGSNIRIPDSLEIKLPNVETPVVYNYVSMVYRTKLDFKYRNGRKIEYSVIEGGEFGGRTTEILMIGDAEKDMDYEEFKGFVKDTVEFVEELDVVADSKEN
ncbi:hypothetical protein WICPIJ_002025 [Wickerhamomyces pijperi]|uniref:Uncharacterized protein n=1 Tax=Wickerhamomyces pijperi TaxID=599730 RepID=A0A9P8QC79_WICPI|nr:hypothetical protein WICPIJ_002025 [Wickerhamomyces pijperi]